MNYYCIRRYNSIQFSLAFKQLELYIFDIEISISYSFRRFRCTFVVICILLSYTSFRMEF